MIETWKLQLKRLNNSGFFSILVSSVFSKVIAFLSVIVLARILSKENYGIYSYAINAMTMLYIFNDFGASQAALQYLTEAQNSKQRQQVILKFALKIGGIGSIFSGVLILLSPLFYPYEIVEAKYLTPILFLIPLLNNVNAFISIVLRANFETKKYAFYELIKTFLNYFFLILLSINFGLKGAIISQYIYTIIGLVIGVKFTKNLMGKFYQAGEFKKEEKKSFMKFSLTTQISATMNSMLLNIDIFIIGMVLASSEAVALYKVASTIPMALSFLPTCVITYVLPYFVKHNGELRWLKENHSKMIKFGFIGYGIMTFVLILSAKLIFGILYTHEYDEAIITFKILMMGFFFSATFKIPTSNILYAMRKLKYNLIVTITSVLFNFIFIVLFIHLFGMNGAAITTTTINILSAILLLFYMKKTMKEEGEKNEERVS